MTNELRKQLESLGLLETYQQKQDKTQNTDDLQAQTLVRLPRPIISSIDCPNPADFLSNIADSSETLDLRNEQNKDPDIKLVEQWILKKPYPI